MNTSRTPLPTEAHPLCWPSGRMRTLYPKRSRFENTITFGRARDVLIHELKLLITTDVILSTNIPLKNDGMPYATFATPKDKGVAIYFKYKKKPMVFACDEWDRIEHNVWAIAKTIEALRGIERWGSGDMLERAFTGFTALPNPSTKKHWREVLGFMGQPHVGMTFVHERFKDLAKQHHPDTGGDSNKMAELNRAYQEAKEELG